jgi:DUF2934 family protein
MPMTRKAFPAEMTKTGAHGSSLDRAEIALRAYHIYLERGSAPGNELDDWTRAERELLGTNGKSHRKVRPKSKAA